MNKEELESIIKDERSTELAKVCAESALKDLRIKELEAVVSNNGSKSAQVD